MPAKYVCTSYNDDFFTESGADAMEHLTNHPDHELLVIDRDQYGNIVTRTLKETEK